jgi:DNA-binding MarR family transcriptional regulator
MEYLRDLRKKGFQKTMGKLKHDNYDEWLKKVKESCALTDNEVRTIRALYDTDKLTFKQLAEVFKVSKTTIKNVVRKNTYKWVK